MNSLTIWISPVLPTAYFSLIKGTNKYRAEYAPSIAAIVLRWNQFILFIQLPCEPVLIITNVARIELIYRALLLEIIIRILTRTDF